MCKRIRDQIVAGETRAQTLLRSSGPAVSCMLRLPFTTNGFAFEIYDSIPRIGKTFRNHSRGQIREVQCEFPSWMLRNVQGLGRKLRGMNFEKWFPGLQRVHIHVFPSSSWEKDAFTFTDCEAIIQRGIIPNFQKRGYKVTTEKMSLNIPNFIVQ